MQVGENGQNNRVKKLDKNPSSFLNRFQLKCRLINQGFSFLTA